MAKSIQHTTGSDWQERAIIAALVIACVVLAVLQYRWTGDLSRAESERLLASAGPRLQQFARAFDTELRQSVLEFVPSGEEVRNLGPLRADNDRLKSALPQLNRPMFRRIAAAIREPTSNQLRFHQADLTSQSYAPAEWPASPDWQSLRDRLQAIANGGSPQGSVVDPRSALIEVPVFAEDQESEWILLELDTAYVAKDWLPELARTYFNPEADDTFELSVTQPGLAPIFGRAATQRADAEASIFPIRFLGPEGRRGGRPTPGRWNAQLSHGAGAVPASVESARRRNLIIAALPLLLIAAAGIALVRNSRRAHRLAEAQYQFFAGMSHELRTPLTVIQGAGHNLLSGVVHDDDPAKRESYVRAIVKQSAQLNEMIDQVLANSSLHPRLEESTSLDVIVSDAIETAAPELEQTHRSVDVDMPPDLPQVRGDQTSLRRVLGNLILNAIRHGGGEVKVMATRQGSHVEVRVADSGDGIPAAELNQIFDPFFRGQRARNGRTRGTGLGLSLVKETIEKLGGTVAVESQPGKGTTFTVRLPITNQ